MRKLARGLGFILIALAGRPALADILNFQLTPAAAEFTGTLMNPGTSDVYLNGDVSSLPYPDLMVDGSPFFTFSPLFLPGGGTYTGPFFDVDVSPSAASMTYDGTFTIQGGADANSFDNLAEQDFTVVVGSEVPVSEVPEPNSLMLSVTVALIMAAVMRGRDRRRVGESGKLSL
jgi:hypothetical protein